MINTVEFLRISLIKLGYIVLLPFTKFKLIAKKAKISRLIKKLKKLKKLKPLTKIKALNTKASINLKSLSATFGSNLVNNARKLRNHVRSLVAHIKLTNRSFKVHTPKRQHKFSWNRKRVTIKELLKLQFTKVRVVTATLKLPDISKFKIKSARILVWFIPFSIGVLAAIFFLFVPYQISSWFRELPSPDLLLVDGSARSTKILDRKGRLLYEIYVDRKYDPVKLAQVPDTLKHATIAVEDSEFYAHMGFSVKGIVRAVRENIIGENLQGGSTITQQLIKTVLLSPERTISRKVKELALSILVEAKYSKEQILEMYLNNIPYGGTAWGVQSAAQKYFGKNVWELHLAESALLAGLPSAPSMYSPNQDMTLAKMRQKYVLDRMVELKYITQTDADDAYDQELVFAQGEDFVKAPHFVDFVKNQLGEMYGRRFVDTGGLTVTTSLDLDLQDQVQSAVASEIERSAYLNISNGAAIVMAPKTSEILAYVGSVDYYKPEWGAFDVASAHRQPGSAIKPITYSLALAQGYSTVSILKDSPVTFQTKGSPSYTPVNYDGAFHGDVTVRAALANSYNIPAIRLAAALGPDNIVTLGHEMGLTDWYVDTTYGLSVTLGGKEVRLLDLTNVYGTLARSGMYKPYTTILTVKDNLGYEIYNAKNQSSKQVLSEEVAYLIWNILSDNTAREPAFGARNNLVVAGHRVAVKTGTTDSKRDNWTLGYTPSYVVGVWVGNNDNTPMNPYLASGVSGAAPIWHKIVAMLLDGKPDEQMTMPGGVFVKSDIACGVTDYFIKGSNVPSSLCATKADEEKGNSKSKKKRG